MNTEIFVFTRLSTKCQKQTPKRWEGQILPTDTIEHRNVWKLRWGSKEWLHFPKPWNLTTCSRRGRHPEIFTFKRQEKGWFLHQTKLKFGTKMKHKLVFRQRHYFGPDWWFWNTAYNFFKNWRGPNSTDQNNTPPPPDFRVTDFDWSIKPAGKTEFRGVRNIQ